MTVKQISPRRRFKTGLLLFLLILPILACNLSSPLSLPQNQIRLAVYEYEQANYGPTDQLVVHFQRTEPRFTFPNQNVEGRRTVWVDNFGAGEYFSKLPPQTTYLYIQNISKGDAENSATVTVYRGDGAGYEGHQLTLTESPGGSWQVTDEASIAAQTPDDE